MAKASVSLQGQGQGGSYHQIFLFGERGKKKTTKKATLGLVGPPQTKATWVVAWVRKHAKWDRVVGTVQPIMCQRFNQGGGSRVMEGLLSTPKLVLLNKCPPPPGISAAYLSAFGPGFLPSPGSAEGRTRPGWPFPFAKEPERRERPFLSKRQENSAALGASSQRGNGGWSHRAHQPAKRGHLHNKRESGLSKRSSQDRGTETWCLLWS